MKFNIFCCFYYHQEDNEKTAEDDSDSGGYMPFSTVDPIDCEDVRSIRMQCNGSGSGDQNLDASNEKILEAPKIPEPLYSKIMKPKKVSRTFLSNLKISSLYGSMVSLHIDNIKFTKFSELQGVMRVFLCVQKGCVCMCVNHMFFFCM